MGVGATNQNIIVRVERPKFFLEPFYDFLLITLVAAHISTDTMTTGFPGP